MDATSALLSKTKICKYYVKGRCKRGEACSYAHGKEQLLARPDLYRTQLCIDYTVAGACQAGDTCRFAHGAEDIRPVT
eukprot:CAMPEP_0115244536 /NCGR_PEP_ID=MMETSP0270-20121206/40035_1 /TAXON_ID=71861 /ORGANISM="Scrippsiella trochoidea, Strain CCMP3099" /LENGTH=77 /DNA_ID=CAMNT_0002659669 /DNA_START=298 /DNA_END=528 /DNA_ORIENTATION=+